MSAELTILTLAALLQIVQYVLMIIPANRELGTGKTLSPRDQTRLGGSLESQVSDRTARLFRALNNHFEALALFAIAVLLIELSGQNSGVTTALAALYLGARILYVPAYAFGWVPWRTIIWGTGFSATTLLLLAALI